MEENQLTSYLKKMHSGTPEKEWLWDARNSLLRHMRKSPAVKRGFADLFFAQLHGLLSQKLFMQGLAVVLLLLGGLTSVFAARNTLPTSPFYPMKLVLERTQRTFALTNEQKADFDLAAAQERVHELTKLSTAGRGSRGAASAPSAVIAQSFKRSSAALSDSAKTVKLMRSNGQNDLAKVKAEELQRTVSAYTSLLAALDTSTTSALVLEDVKSAVAETQETIGEILNVEPSMGTNDPSPSPGVSPENGVTASTTVSVTSASPTSPSTAGTPAPEASITPDPSPETPPSGTSGPLPNVVE